MPRRGRNPVREAEEYGPSPGELYGEIPVRERVFEVSETTLVRKTVNSFVRFCRGVNKAMPSLGNGGKFNEQNKEAVEFLNWDLTAEEFSAASKFTLLVSLVIGLATGMLLYFSPVKGIVDAVTSGMPFLTPVYLFAPFLIIALYLTNYVQTYPIKAANVEKVRALTYVPEILGYMVMSMKLVPNLEKAIEFAAKHGRGKIADDLRNLIWEVQLGVHTTLSEALDALAYRWGSFSEEFKRALMMVRASVIEDTEAKRYALLDNTMAEVLDSIKAKMEQYARDLSQPSIMLFYIGVLLPLILIIILPVGSSFSGAPLANPIVLALIYNILIPAVTIAFAINLIRQRPPTYESPKIPDSFPGLPPKGTMRLGKLNLSITLVLIVVLIAGVGTSLLLSNQGLPPRFLLEEGAQQILSYDRTEQEVLSSDGKNPNYYAPDSTGIRYNELRSQGRPPEEAETLVLSERTTYFMKAENDIAPYNLVFGLLLTFGILSFIALYYPNIEKRRVQEDVAIMESEFKDSLYVLASRMGENKPVEEALKHTRTFLPKLKISERIFGRTVDNISLLAMPLESAVFDPNYGSLRDSPSAIIRGSMRLLVDSVQLGVNVAARTMISLSIQLSNSQKVSQNLKVLVSDITGMMRTMTIFIAPVVLGITTSLQKIVIMTLSSIAASSFVESSSGPDLTELGVSGIASNFSGASVSSFIDPSAIATMATPTQFIIIVAIYIIELVIIMGYFTTKIEEDNDIMVRINIARSLPVALAVFVASIIVSNMLVGGFMGG
ncbi:MAG: hypothetical protein ABH854_00045 [Candidatus Diapherotrites archaeon]